MVKSGFTLIELAIVLVIIGLITGGILVGQDLIKAAEIRHTISQKGKIETAIKAFKLKYNHLAGDMPPSSAAQYDLFQITTGAGSHGFGDGNGLLAGGPNDDNGPYWGGEHIVFWRHLSDARMIDGSYGQNIDGAATSGFTYLDFPKTKFGEMIFFMETYQNYMYLTISGALMQDYSNWDTASSLSPQSSYSIDSKIDDGMPNTGRVLGDANYWNANPITGVCIYGGGDNFSVTAQYNINPATGGNDNNCTDLKMRVQ